MRKEAIRILGNQLKSGDITQDQYNDAMKDPLSYGLKAWGPEGIKPIK